MRALISIFMLIISVAINADDIKNYKHYQIDSNISDGKGPYYAIYIKKSDPCIYLDDFRKDISKKYCEMGNSGLDLKRDHPTIYPSNLRVSGTRLYFTVAAPWNEQKCEIFFPDKSITCESTGR